MREILPRELPVPEKSLSRERETMQIGGYRYQISPAELETMREIGRFRTITLNDLARFHYGGNKAEFREDLESMRAQGLVQCRTVCFSGKGDKLSVIVLSKLGKEVLESRLPKGLSQMLFAGFVKPAEVRHDAAIYRMYQVEAARLRRAGGRIGRVVLDYELKQKIYSPLAKARALPPPEYARRQAEIARQNGLKVVRGKILLPDLRIEYESRSGERAHVDLELATDHYRGAHMRGKTEAGFKMYAPKDSAARLSAAYDPEFAAEIFSF
jgi:hypothetical protein